jgi:hypothetical protein
LQARLRQMFPDAEVALGSTQRLPVP